MALNLIEIQNSYLSIFANILTIEQLSHEKPRTTEGIDHYIVEVEALLAAIRKDNHRLEELEKQKD